MLPSPATRWDIEAQWTINLICNYSCGYCFSSASHDPPLTGLLSPKRCARFFEQTGKTWLVNMTGGEPFFLKNFVELCAALSKSQYLAMNSNLSSPKVRIFADTIDPERVDFIHLGLHPEERDKRNGWAQLEQNLQALVSGGFPVFASAVMTPEAFPLFERCRDRLAALGVVLFPKAMRGEHHGLRYPESFTAAERAAFVHFSEQAENSSMASPHRPMRHNPTIRLQADRFFLDHVRDFTGVPCSAGRTLVMIGPDGNIFTCGTTGRIGNMFLGSLKLAEDDAPCRSEWCHFVCTRYSAVDEHGAKRLPVLRSNPTMVTKLTQIATRVERRIVNEYVTRSAAIAL